MSKNRWPSLDRDGTYKGTPPQEQCDCCARPVVGFSDVRFGPMRGSDIDTFYLCARHLKMARDNLDRMIAHHRTNDKWVAERDDRPEPQHKHVTP